MKCYFGVCQSNYRPATIPSCDCHAVSDLVQPKLTIGQAPVYQNNTLTHSEEWTAQCGHMPVHPDHPFVSLFRQVHSLLKENKCEHWRPWHGVSIERAIGNRILLEKLM
jgi:hypothetical protein